MADTWYIKFPKALSLIEKQAKILNKEGFGNPILDNCNLLYGEYLTSKFISRSKALKMVENSFKRLSKNDSIVAFRPNDYLFKYVSEYRNIPMTSSQYLFETDSVPFLQLVLSGRLKMFAPYTNEDFYSRENILRSIEYNCYPSFLLTEVENSELEKTSIADKSSTAFVDWQTKIAEVYDDIVPILSQVKGCQMIDREVLEVGVTVVHYENGGCIAVNYTNKDFNYKGTVIKSENAVFINNKGEG